MRGKRSRKGFAPCWARRRVGDGDGAGKMAFKAGGVQMNRHEAISSWMDGETEARQSEGLPSQVLQDAESRRRWNEWHLIGDVMRSPSLGRDTALADRIAQRLVAEPVLLPSSDLRSTRRQLVRKSRVAAAAAAAAAVAFVAVVAVAPQIHQDGVPGLIAATGFGAKPSLSSLEQASVQSIPEDPRLRDLLETHGSMSIRPVSFEAR